LRNFLTDTNTPTLQNSHKFANFKESTLRLLSEASFKVKGNIFPHLHPFLLAGKHFELGVINEPKIMAHPLTCPSSPLKVANKNGDENPVLF
jgi:hypothetical protein